MGYSTDFSGSLDIHPALTPEVMQEINEFCDDRHDGHEIGIWCDWQVGEDGDLIQWNESEKSYAMKEWLEHLIREFIAPTGSKVNGVVMAQGEDAEDRWDIEVLDNVVTRTEYTVVRVKEQEEPAPTPTPEPPFSRYELRIMREVMDHFITTTRRLQKNDTRKILLDLRDKIVRMRG